MSLLGWALGPFFCAGQTATPRRSEVENIYHCCVHKTASQWIARILSAEEIYLGCGLRTYSYQRDLPGGSDTRKITDRTFDCGFPKASIVTPVYIGRENFRAFPKPRSWRAFAVVRDPRDVLVSWYFSWKHSHPVMGDVGEHRRKLHSFGQEDGLCYAVERLQERGLFTALESWNPLAPTCGSVAIFRYEDLIGETQLSTFERLFAHCDIAVSRPKLQKLLAENSFTTLTRGRKRGVEDIHSHLRKGTPGDWRNHFTARVKETFDGITSNLAARLGYDADAAAFTAAPRRSEWTSSIRR